MEKQPDQSKGMTSAYELMITNLRNSRVSPACMESVFEFECMSELLVSFMLCSFSLSMTQNLKKLGFSLLRSDEDFSFEPFFLGLMCSMSVMI